MDFSWLWIVPVLGILVIIHELGHFLTARWLGIRVEEFGIGYPPRAFAIRHNNIDYSLNWLPLGGFVRILGENGDSDDADSFGRAAAWKRIIVLSAGSFMNLVLALVIFIGLGVFGDRIAYDGIAVAQVVDGSPAATAGMQAGDVFVSIDGNLIRSNDDARYFINGNAGHSVKIVLDRYGQQITVDTTPRANPPIDQGALGVALQPVVFPVSASKVADGSAAANFGVKVDDVITQFNGKPVPNTWALQHEISEAWNAAPKDAAGNTQPPDVNMTVQRGGETLQLQGKLTQNALGGMTYKVVGHTVQYGVAQSLERGFMKMTDLFKAIPQSLAQLFSGKSEGTSFAGPVGIAQLTGEVGREGGIPALINLMAILSINLFLVNMLPLPALDGGRLLFILIELVRRGKRIAPEKEGMVHLVGMGVLLLLMLLITVFDVQRLITGGSILTP